jgi:hypothetical protein
VSEEAAKTKAIQLIVDEAADTPAKVRDSRERNQNGDQEPASDGVAKKKEKGGQGGGKCTNGLAELVGLRVIGALVGADEAKRAKHKTVDEGVRAKTKGECRNEEDSCLDRHRLPAIQEVGGHQHGDGEKLSGFYCGMIDYRVHGRLTCRG